MLGELSSMDSVQNAAKVICASETCRSRLNDYADYLLTCRVGNLDYEEFDRGSVCHHKIAG